MQGKKLTIGYIKKQFEKEDYILLTKKYINCEQKLDYICPKRHKHSITWLNWHQNRRCPYCSNKARLTIEFIKSEFERKGYLLLSTEYVNKQKLEYVCLNGHKHSIEWKHFKEGHGCPYCINVGKLTMKFVKNEFAKEGYRLLTTEYINAHQKLDYICPKGHRHSINWNNWKNGNRCPYCFSNISKWEIEVKKFLDDSNINYMPNNRTQLINPNTKNCLELDIWMPELNKAIECNGIYWHTSKERKRCDSIKQQLCKDKNINLLTITDKEWNENIEKCKSKVINFIEN